MCRAYERLLSCGLIMIAFVGPAAAQADLPPHQPHLLAADASLDLAHVVMQAVARHPDAERLAGIEAEADAFAYAADYPLAASPSLIVGYERDAPGEEAGAREYQAGLQMPIKWFGQGAAQRRLAERARALAERDNSAFVWRVTGLVRTVLWELHLARNDFENAGEALSASRALREAVAARVDAGDLPLADAVLAESDEVDRQAELLAAEGQLNDITRRYTLLTGLDRYPAALHEPLAPLEVLPADHPAMVAAAALAQRFGAERDTRGMTNAITMPLVTLGSRHLRGGRGQPWDDSLGVSVQYPFGLGPQGRIEAAAAMRDQTEALVAQRQLERDLQQALGEAHHELEHAQRAVVLAQRREALSERREAIARVAFEEGETDLAEYVRIRAARRGAVRELTQWQLRVGWAAANVNQALGIVPAGVEVPAAAARTGEP